MKQNKYWEYVHVPMWLIKDTCWMLDYEALGVAMILPTVSISIFLAWRTRGREEFFISLAICFWIMANASWMSCDFFDIENYSAYVLTFFVLGMVSISIFYIRLFLNTSIGKKFRYSVTHLDEFDIFR